MKTIIELCPYCDTEVQLENKFVPQTCPNCGRVILPCSICEHTNPNGCHTKCDTCPLGRLDGKDISSASIYYESVRVIDHLGQQYFLSQQDLSEIVSRLNFKCEKKLKRVWLKPIFDEIVETKTQFLNKNEITKLKEVLDQFEHATLLDTGTKKISGGFALAELTGYDNHWLYIRLKWGVQNDVDNDTHTEDWKLAREILSRNISVKEMVKYIDE